MADDFYGYDDDGDEPKGRDNLFLWTVFILLLIGLAFACWLGSFYIFGHPEKPASYRFLKKIGKIEAPRRFEVTAAPQGEFLTAQKLFERYGRMTRLELEEENARLMRDYIKNYRETKLLVTYVVGRFIILEAFDLKKTDLFSTGVVALAQAADMSQVVIEHVYTSSPRYVPAIRTLLQTGHDTNIKKTDDLSALLHIERLADGHMQFTVVPLLYGAYALKNGVGTFSLEPPQDLNMEAGLPVVKLQSFQDGVKKFANYRRTHPLASADPSANAVTPPPTPELVRIDTVQPGTTVPLTGALPPVPVATPIPLAGKGPPSVPGTRPAATPPMAVAMLATPAPRPVATPIPAPVAPPPRVSPTGVPLQPFIEAKRDPNMPTTGGSWRTYPAGKAPPGRAVTPAEAGDLADRGELGERIYLRGDFRVTATVENRAVLRERIAGADGTARIIVEYAAGAIPPAESTSLNRDETRPFEIRDVRRGADGQINIYVREIIQQ